MRTERAMTSRIHCTVASSEHNQEESKLNKKTALPILFVSLSCTCFRGGGKGRGKGDRREGGRRRRGTWRKTRNTSSLVPQPGNFVMFRGSAGGVRKGMPNKNA